MAILDYIIFVSKVLLSCEVFTFMDYPKTAAATIRCVLDNWIFSENVHHASQYNDMKQLISWRRIISMSPTPNHNAEGMKLSEEKNILRLWVFFLYRFGFFLICTYDTTLAYSSGHLWFKLLEACCMWSSVQSDNSPATEVCECTDFVFDVCLVATSSLPICIHKTHQWDMIKWQIHQ